jgi:hypothetical protein
MLARSRCNQRPQAHRCRQNAAISRIKLRGGSMNMEESMSEKQPEDTSGTNGKVLPGKMS